MQPFLPNRLLGNNQQPQNHDAHIPAGYFEWDFSVHFGGGYRFQINDNLGVGIDYRFLSNFNDINEERLRYELHDQKSGKYNRYSPKMMNQDNHVLSVGIFMSPRLFLGLEK